jgi:hypothetical protein
MITLSLIAVLSTSQAAAPQAWVVLSRKSGVATPRAMEITAEVQSQLVGVPTTGAPDDLSACKGKKVCVMDAARKKNVPVVVTVEVGAVLKDGTLRVEALSVEEDGRQLAVAEADGPSEGLVAKSAPQLKSEFSAALRKALGLTPPPAPKAEPPPPPAPLVVAPPPPPTPATTEPMKSEPAAAVTAPASTGPSFFTPGRIAGLAAAGVGVAMVVVGGVFGAQASAGSARVRELCPMSAGCTNAEAFSTWSTAKGNEYTFIGLTVGGALVAAGGAVLFLLNPGAEPPAASAVIVPVPGGAAGAFSVRF